MTKIAKPNQLFILILGILAMLPPLAIDMYLPAFLEIAYDLQVSQEKVQQTLALYTLGFAIGQLFWGPIADSYGRKPVILLGVVVSAIAAFFLTQVFDIYNFYGIRFIQGLFGAAPAVVLNAVLRDKFQKNQFAKMMSLIMMVSMFAPLVAPILGGYLVKWFHWHAIFYTLAVLGVISAILFSIKIEETLKPEQRLPLKLGTIYYNFLNLLSNKAVVGYLFAGAFSFAGMFCFLTSGSLVYIGIYKVQPEHFGYFFILNITILMIMNAINSRIVTKVGAEFMLKIGLFIQLLAGIWLAIVVSLQLGFWPLVIGVALYVGMISLVGSGAMAAILDNYPKFAGTASSLAGTVRFGVTSIVAFLLSCVPVSSDRPMAYAIAICAVLASAIYFFLSYKKGNK